MIYDALTQLSRCRSLSPNLATAIDWLTATELAGLEADGQRRAIDGDRVAAIVSRYMTLDPDAFIWESHRRYIDIQILLAGEEQIGVVPLSDNLRVTEPYVEAKDAQFYARDTSAAAKLHMIPGRFAIFFPQDVHGPNQTWGSAPAQVTKLVLKVSV